MSISLCADTPSYKSGQDVFKKRKPVFDDANRFDSKRGEHPVIPEELPPVEGIPTRDHLLKTNREAIQKEQRQKLIQDLIEEGLVSRPSNAAAAGPQPVQHAMTGSVSASGPASNSTLESSIDQELQEMYRAPALVKQKISLSTPAMPTKKLLESITKLSHLNLMIDQDISGKFGPLSVKKKSVGEVLQMIANTNKPKLALLSAGEDVWKIMPRTEAIESLKGEYGSKRESKVISIKHAKMTPRFKKLVKKTWHSINSGLEGDGTFLHIDDAERHIAVRGRPGSIQELYKFLFHIDKPIIQVRIDAILVLADKQRNFDFGIDWSGIYNRQATREATSSTGFWGLGGTLTDFPTPTSSTVDNNSNLLVNPTNFALNLFSSIKDLLRTGTFNAAIADTIQIPFIWGGPDLNLKRLSLALNAAEAEAKLKIVSRPSVLTSNHETAKLMIGETIPLQTAIEDIVQGQSRNITTINYKDTGIVLEVTPVIDAENNTVTLDIFIEDSQVVSGSTKANSQGVMEDPPLIEIIKAQNKVILQSGQTTIIGGLSSNRDESASNKVPFLNKLPFFGKYFFSSFFDFNRARERFIFITPTIISQEVWD